MSTRSRRSTAADAGGLNPATIFLLPISKLKEELQNRGLAVLKYLNFTFYIRT
jgi:hypothetical protein